MGVVRSSGSASVRFRDRSSEKKRNPFEKRKSGVFSAQRRSKAASWPWRTRKPDILTKADGCMRRGTPAGGGGGGADAADAAANAAAASPTRMRIWTEGRQSSSFMYPGSWGPTDPYRKVSNLNYRLLCPNKYTIELRYAPYSSSSSPSLSPPSFSSS